jgi:hypothetical protein
MKKVVSAVLGDAQEKQRCEQHPQDQVVNAARRVQRPVAAIMKNIAQRALAVANQQNGEGRQPQTDLGRPHGEPYDANIARNVPERAQHVRTQQMSVWHR